MPFLQYMPLIYNDNFCDFVSELFKSLNAQSLLIFIEFLQLGGIDKHFMAINLKDFSR